MRELVINEILQRKIISIVRGVDPEKALFVADALYKGGIRLIEITFNQKNPDEFINTCKAISAIKQRFDMRVGAGTVTSTELVNMAADAGAEYIISPDTDVAVIAETLKRGLVSIPGAYTAGEAKTAHNAGADFVKLFPCTDSAVLKGLCGPFNNIRFLAVGGVNVTNVDEFIKAGAVGIGVGGCLVKKEWVADGNYAAITNEAKKFVEILNK